MISEKYLGDDWEVYVLYYMEFMNKQESSPPTCKAIKNEYLKNKYSTMENSFSIFIFKLNENVKLHFILLTNYCKNHLEAQNYYDFFFLSDQK